MRRDLDRISSPYAHDKDVRAFIVLTNLPAPRPRRPQRRGAQGGSRARPGLGEPRKWH